MRKLTVKELSKYELDGWDDTDHPDYCDVYISRAWADGMELTEEELEWINENDYEGIFEAMEKELPNNLTGYNG